MELNTGVASREAKSQPLEAKSNVQCGKNIIIAWNICDCCVFLKKWMIYEPETEKVVIDLKERCGIEKEQLVWMEYDWCIDVYKYVS